PYGAPCTTPPIAEARSRSVSVSLREPPACGEAIGEQLGLHANAAGALFVRSRGESRRGIHEQAVPAHEQLTCHADRIPRDALAAIPPARPRRIFPSDFSSLPTENGTEPPAPTGFGTAHLYLAGDTPVSRCITRTGHSTVTVLARFRGWSTSVPFRSAMK